MLVVRVVHYGFISAHFFGFVNFKASKLIRWTWFNIGTKIDWIVPTAWPSVHEAQLENRLLIAHTKRPQS